MTRIVLFVWVALGAACGFAPSGAPGGPGEGPDAGSLDSSHDAAPIIFADAAADGNNSAGQINTACQPVVDQCAEGLTCRFDPTEMIGRCRPIGENTPGAACDSDLSCGANMACLYDGGAKRCFQLCRTVGATDCTSPQRCSNTWGSDVHVGVCGPL